MAMRGAELHAVLHELSREFYKVAVPENGKYVARPARAEDGSAYDKK